MLERRSLILLGALLLAVGLGGLLLASSGAVAQEDNQTQTVESDSGWTLEELRRDGRQPSGSPASVRQSGSSMVWLIHWPSRALWADVGAIDDDEWKFVGEDGDAVTDTSVYLRSIQADGGLDLDLTLVSYRVERTEVTAEDGSTRTEREPVDVVERSIDASLAEGWAISEVPLPNLEEDREILIYAEGHEDDLRWTFSHEPVATQQTAPVSSEGDYLWRVGSQVFFPALIGLFFIGFGVKRAIHRAGAGPNWGLTQWAIALGLVALFGFLFGPVEDFADMLVAAPTIMAIILVTMAGIVALESWEDGTRDVLFVKPDLEPVVSPSGKEAMDAIVAESEDEKVVEMPDGETAVIRGGLLPFLARLFGNAARVRGADLMTASVDLEGSRHDELVFVKPDTYDPGKGKDDHPLADENDEENDDNLPVVRDESTVPADGPIHYKPEGFAFNAPSFASLEDAAKSLSIGGAIIAVGVGVTALSGAWFGIGAAALLAVLWLGEATDGTAWFEPAPGHLRSAMITSMVMASEVADAETLDEARKQNIQLRGQSERDIEQALSNQDATLVETLLRGGEDSDPLNRSVVDNIDSDGPDAGAEGSSGEPAATDGGSEP